MPSGCVNGNIFILNHNFFGVANLIKDNFEYLDEHAIQKFLLLLVGFEPATSCVRSGRQTEHLLIVSLSLLHGKKKLIG